MKTDFGVLLVNLSSQKSTKHGQKVNSFSMEKSCKRGVSFRAYYQCNEPNPLLSMILRYGVTALQLENVLLSAEN